MSLDHEIHLSREFSDERLFCACGEELVYAQEHEAAKCLKCLQDEQAKKREEEG